MKCIEYKGGFKYQLQKQYLTETEILPDQPVVKHKSFISLDVNGRMVIEVGYAWDGPSGPTFDTLNFMRGSLVHDAFYQLMREGVLDPIKFRKPADQLIRKMCKEDGMNPIRAWWIYSALRLMGKKAASRKASPGALHAPEGCPLSV